ncbi:MAG TPA: adenylate/guanylate cyclase domain-containing protein [Thermodesulfobacteriota bacterium]
MERSDKNFLFVGIAIGLFSALLSLSLYTWSPSFLNEVDLRYSDFRFKTRGNIEPNPKVVIVAIDEKSINQLGRWPWSRYLIAEFIEKLSDYKPKVVGFDILFSEQESKDADIALGKAVEKSRNIILGYFFRDDATEEPTTASLKQVKRSNIKLIKYLDKPPSNVLKTFRSADLNLPEIGAGALGFGFFNMLPDGDGIFRRSQLLMSYDGEIYPSLNLESIRLFLGGDLWLTMASYGVEALNINKTQIPTDESGQLLVNFYGPGGTFKTYSAVDVVSGKVPVEALENKIVLVGATEIGIADLRPTPFNPVFPGVEIHASVAGNILDGRFLIENNLTHALDIGLLFMLPILLVFLLIRARGTVIGFTIFIVFVFLYLLGNFVIFTRLNFVISTIYPALSIGFAYVFFEAYRNLVIERRSRYLRKAFSSYVSSDIVDEILRDPDKLKLGGENKNVTLLFSDIRGFTSLSESIPPEMLVSVLNEYLSPMTQIVMEERGTLDKYIGDAVMAIFGAPLDVPDHATRACQASLSMLKKLGQINNEWRKRNFPTISIGIGINTGAAIVGNMGANMRFDYTAIGDSVNLASRLEGLNKLYGTEIIISKSTLENLNSSEAPFLFRELDLVQVKGKEEPISIFELVNTFSGDSNKTDLVRMFTEALNTYREGKFLAAKEKFAEILLNFPNDTPSALYKERCQEYILHPPPLDWTGVYTAKEK